MATSQQKLCNRCHKVMKITEFYRSRRLDKYPDGYVDLCKPCFTAHVDNWNPDTYVPLLEEVDAPYLPDEWNELLKRYGQDPEKLTPMTIFGRYLSKMKLTQYKDYRFSDSEHLQKIKEEKIRSALKTQGKSASEIDEAIAAAVVEAPPKPVEPVETSITTATENLNEGLELTEEDITYLKVKWGPTYQPYEWVQLEKLYQDFLNSYDIQSAGHIDTLKMICKTSLKTNQLLDLGDIDGALKMTKAYDTLMRSGKFTAAQNKAESGEFVDSIGEIAMMCEKNGFIPRYYQDTPNDKVDWVIKDNQNYAKRLITEETNLSDMFDKALKQIEEDKAKEEDDEVSGFEEELFSDADGVGEITDEDMIQFKEFEEELEKSDKKKMSENFEKEEKRTIRRKKE